jgi:uncharacterized protein YggE
VGMLGGAWLLAQGDYSPTVNVAAGDSQLPVHSISTSATSSQKTAPDLLVMQLRVQTEAPTAKDAVQENANVAADLKGKLKALGLADEEIQTTSYSVDEITETNYTCDRNGYNCRYTYRVTGYRVVNTIGLEIKDLAKGGDVIDSASSAGVNETFVDYLSFTLKDETRREMQKSLLKSAAAEAKAKAQNMAEGSGVALGKALSLSESYSYYPQVSAYRYDSVAMGAEAAKTELSQGQIEVSVTVSASYEIS